MGLHYSLSVYLSRLDNWYLPVYIGWGIAMICFYLFYMESIRYGHKHKCSGMSWQANMWNFQMSAKRKSRKGVAPAVPWALIVAQAVGYFLIMTSFDPVMKNFYVYFMGVAATGIAIAYGIYYRSLPEYVLRHRTL